MRRNIIDWSKMTDKDIENFVNKHSDVSKEVLKEIVKKDKEIKKSPIWLCGTLL